MGNKNVVLEVKVNDTGVPVTEDFEASDEAVREAKRAVVSAMSNLPWWDPALEIMGENTIFPLLVVTGPDQSLDDLSEHVLVDLPDMVCGIDRDMYFSIP